MLNETPKFNESINLILDNINTHLRQCSWFGLNRYCEGKFNIEEKDIEFFKKIQVPPPNFCPTCRRIRRLVHLNISRLFMRKCDVPFHNENFISIFPEECPFPVYDYQYFIGDDFDPFIFADKNISDVNLDSLLSLRKRFPVPSFLNRNPSSVNSEYSNEGSDLKNGYYVTSCQLVENAWYSNMVHKSCEVMDCFTVSDSEFVYECIGSDHLYKTSFSYFSKNCTNSMMLMDCRNCQNCFGCANLRNKNFCVFNEQYTKEEYNKFIESIYPLSLNKLNSLKDKFWNLVKSLPLNGERNILSSDVFGVAISNSKNLYDVVKADNSYNVRHSDGVLSHRDSMDILYSGGNSSMLYMCSNVGSHSSMVKFSVSCKGCLNSEFIFNCKNCDNCFMCFGLQNKSFCILNNQYTKEEYFKKIDKIKYNLLKNNQYSDGVGIEFSAQAYNFSLANISYPLDEREIMSLGGYLAKEPDTNVGNIETINYSNISQYIDEIDDDITKKAIRCNKSGRPFRIIPSELEFYRRMKLPLPDIHPVYRIENRLRLFPDAKKYKTFCMSCKNKIETIFDPEERFLLYCESCYKNEVN